VRRERGVKELRMKSKKVCMLCYQRLSIKEVKNEALIQRATKGCILKHFLAVAPAQHFFVVALTAGVEVLINL